MTDAIDFDDLPEIVDDPNSPHCWERPIVFGPEATRQLREMASKPPPEWLRRIMDERSKT